MEIETNELVRGLVLGVIAGILLFFSVRTEVPYPRWMVKAYEEPLIRIALFAVIFGLSLWDTSAAVMATLVIVFLHTDITLLGMQPKENFITSSPGKPVATFMDEQPKVEKKEGGEEVPVEGTVVSSPFYPLTEDSEPEYVLDGLRPAALT